MAGWHHRLNGHEFEKAPGVGDGQGGLACCRPWGHNDRILKEKLPRSVGTQYATGDYWRNNSRKNDWMEPKQKQ